MIFRADDSIQRTGTVEPVAETARADTKGHAYLFDVTNARLVAAWSIISARERRNRDANRMKRYPQPRGDRYHRGHAIAHAMGGGEEINIVPQPGSTNMGAFRILERRALQHKGALYFTFWIDGAPHQQAPVRVEQGLLIPGVGGEIAVHDNGTPGA